MSVFPLILHIYTYVTVFIFLSNKIIYTITVLYTNWKNKDQSLLSYGRSKAQALKVALIEADRYLIVLAHHEDKGSLLVP